MCVNDRAPNHELIGTPIERLTRTMFTRIISNLSKTLVNEDFSVAQVAALYLLDERQTLRVGELAAELGRSQPSTSRLVDGLVERKLVARREDPTDRRARVLTLTKKGRDTVGRASAERVRTILHVAETAPVPGVAAVLASLR
jgi:DNA-binding MarR family transcriptional regulator